MSGLEAAAETPSQDPNNLTDATPGNDSNITLPESSAQNSPTPSESTAEDSTPAANHQPSTAEDLEQLSQKIVDLLNNRQYSNPLLSTYLSPSFRAAYDWKPPIQGRETYLAFIEDETADNWQSITDVQSTAAKVYKGRGKAHIFVTTSVRGLPWEGHGEMVRESVSVMKWRKGREGWRLIERESIMGSSGFT